VLRALLDDPDYRRLTAEARHVLLALRLCREPDAGLVAERTGLPAASVTRAMEELATSRWITAATAAAASAPDPLMTPEEFVALYNRWAPPGHPRVRRLSPARREKALRYLRQFQHRAFWVQVFRELALSTLLTRGGGPGHEHFRGDLDWLLTRGKDGTENCVKTAEGKYRDPDKRHVVLDELPVTPEG
jgi:hypothetical protein